jgi:hypothetical protein
MEPTVKNVIASIAVCIFATVGGDGLAAAQSAGSVLPIFVDYDKPPTHIDELTMIADAVAAVRIEAIRFRSAVDQKGAPAGNVTDYNVRVVDNVKPHPMLPPNQGTFTITRLGGQRTENGKVVRSAEVGFEEFVENGEYALFLSWNKRTNQFNIMYGPNGCYQFDAEGKVKPLGRADVASKQQGKGRGMFLQELRVASVR